MTLSAFVIVGRDACRLGIAPTMAAAGYPETARGIQPYNPAKAKNSLP
jgi:hypothetical protein